MEELLEYLNGSSSTGIVSDTSISYDEAQPNLAALVLLLIPLATIFGNLLVVISVSKEKTLRTATNYLLISMACADLLVATCVMPFAVYVEVENGHWRLPKSLCTVYTATDVCASTASILNLVAISWDRYMAVSKPLQYSRSRRKNRRVFYAVIVVWFVSFIIALPMATGLNRLDDTPYCEFTNATYIIVSSFASFFLPCLVMVTLYGVVLHKLRRRQQQIRSARRNRYSKTSGASRNSKYLHPSQYDATTTNTIAGRTSDYSLTAAATQTRISSLDTRLTDAERTLATPTKEVIDKPSSSSDEFIGSSSAHRPASPQMAPCAEPDELEIDKEDLLFISSASDDSHQHLSSCSPSPCTTPDPDRLLCVDSDDESVPFIDSANAARLNEKQETSLCYGSSVSCNGVAALVAAPLTMSAYSNGSGCEEDQPARSIALPVIEINEVQSDKKNDSIVQIDQNGALTNAKNGNSNCLGSDLNRSTVTSPRRESAMSISGLATRLREMAAKRAAEGEALRRRVQRKSARKAAAKYSKQCRRERKATYMLAVVLVVFLACWLPFFTCHMTNSVCIVQTGETCINIVAFFFTTWLGYMNSFMNPLIYTIFNPEYRRAFKRILCCKGNASRRK